MSETNDEVWRSAIGMMTDIVNDVNERNGWHDDSRPFAADIALLHSEVSETYEAYRDHGFMDVTDYDVQGLPKPEGVKSEMADVFIRLLDTCGRYNIDLVAEFTRKMAYNETRGYKHGGKKE